MPLWVMLPLALALTLWALSVAPSFRECVHVQKAASFYSPLHRDHSRMQGMQVRSSLSLVCAGEFTDKNHDVINTVATVAVALFTLALWVSTHRLWKAAVQQSADTQASLSISKRAADAAFKQAQIAERAFVGLERPFVLVDDIKVSISDHDGPIADGLYLKASSMRTGRATVIFSLRNFGRMPATVRDVQFEIVFASDFPARDIKSHGPLKEERTIGSDQLVTPPFRCSITFDHDGNGRWSEPPKLFFWCTYIYLDVFGHLYVRKYGARITTTGRVDVIDGVDFNSEGRIDLTTREAVNLPHLDQTAL